MQLCWIVLMFFDFWPTKWNERCVCADKFLPRISVNNIIFNSWRSSKSKLSPAHWQRVLKNEYKLRQRVLYCSLCHSILTQAKIELWLHFSFEIIQYPFLSGYYTWWTIKFQNHTVYNGHNAAVKLLSDKCNITVQY